MFRGLKTAASCSPEMVAIFDGGALYRRGVLSNGALECGFIVSLLNLAMLVLFAIKQTSWFIYQQI
jgi:hypothetical protein